MISEKSQQAWDNAFKEKQFAFQKSSTGGSGGSSSGGSRSSSGSSGGNYSESQMWSEFQWHLAADLKNGSYESGRFVQKIAKQNPGAAKEMQKLYDEARKNVAILLNRALRVRLQTTVINHNRRILWQKERYTQRHN